MPAGSSCRSMARWPRARFCVWCGGPDAQQEPMMLTRELLARLPKAELHTHLDSALRPTTMIELAREAKFVLPTTDPEALRRFMVVSDASSLEDYLARF